MSTTFAYRDSTIVQARSSIHLRTGHAALVRTGRNVREYDFRLPDDTVILGLRGRNAKAEHWLEGEHSSAVRVVKELGVLPKGTHLRGYAVPAEDAEFLFVHLGPTAITECREELKIPKSELRPAIPHPSVRIGMTLRKMAYELEDPGAGGAAFMEAMMTVLTIELARDGTDTAVQAASAKLSRREIGRVREFIEANLHRDVTLDELAGIVGVSRWHFSRAFKATTGEPPHRYLEARRFDLACRLLEDRRLSISEIAHSVGFGGASQFARAFRRAQGMSPGQFRLRRS